MKSKIKVIAFDADDTLWVNEPYFRETELAFCALLEDILPQQVVLEELFKIEMKNLPLYGYGIKGFVLCMIETAYSITEGKASSKLIHDVIQLGQAMLQRPVELLDGVQEVLGELKGHYRLVLATKGDLLDQERKLRLSGLESYFHHIEVMSDKKASDYSKLLRHLDCVAEKFLMIGNSVKSDVLPVLELNGHAAHIPFHTTWIHEQHDDPVQHPNFLELRALNDILPYLAP